MQGQKYKTHSDVVPSVETLSRMPASAAVLQILERASAKIDIHRLSPRALTHVVSCYAHLRVDASVAVPVLYLALSVLSARETVLPPECVVNIMRGICAYAGVRPSRCCISLLCSWRCSRPRCWNIDCMHSQLARLAHQRARDCLGCQLQDLCSIVVQRTVCLGHVRSGAGTICVRRISKLVVWRATVTVPV